MLKMEGKKEFVVYITETLQRKVIIEANNESEAINEIADKYYNEEIVLDNTDYLSVEFDTKEK